jgi:hypothetical protein
MVAADGKSVTLEIEDLRPTWSIAIKYNIQASDGSIVKGLPLLSSQRVMAVPEGTQ